MSLVHYASSDEEDGGAVPASDAARLAVEPPSVASSRDARSPLADDVDAGPPSKRAARGDEDEREEGSERSQDGPQLREPSPPRGGQEGSPGDEAPASRSPPQESLVRRVDSRVTTPYPPGVLPPAPKGEVSEKVADKFAKLVRAHDVQGRDINQQINMNKQYRNPSIYERLIDLMDIDETGSNFALEKYDPLKYGKEFFYDELARIQRQHQRAVERERADRKEISFVESQERRQPPQQQQPPPQLSSQPLLPVPSSALPADISAKVAEAKRKAQMLAAARQ